LCWKARRQGNDEKSVIGGPPGRRKRASGILPSAFPLSGDTGKNSAFLGTKYGWKAAEILARKPQALLRLNRRDWVFTVKTPGALRTT